MLLSFVLRRLAATVVVLLVASFIVYVLTSMSGDPLADLRAAGTRDAQVKIERLTEVLNLDVPPALRYFLWLGGAAGCLIGQCNLGISIAQGEQPVIDALATAMGSTLQLVTLATILAIIVGITIGMTTALRQYSGYDYTVTFFAFVFYSLPIFWVAQGVWRNQIQSIFRKPNPFANSNGFDCPVSWAHHKWHCRWWTKN
jgi:peptide/nickel transport system permease protein